MHRTVFALAVTLATAVSAASISGTITDAATTNALPGMQVRLWEFDAAAKGYVIRQTDTSAAGTGAYAFSGLAVGTYKVDARMPPGVGGNYGDRWFDQAAPTANGYLGADADELIIADAADALTGIDIALEVNGGIDGQVRTPGNAPLAGILVRAELTNDRRVHHNDVSQGSFQLGNYFMRGLSPGTYRLIGHDLNAVYDTTVLASTPAVVAAANTPAAPLLMQLPAVDPYEPNNTGTAADAGIDSTPFRQVPPVAFQTTGARIGPRNSGDVDYFCFDALAGDRFFFAASSTLAGLALDGGAVENPWVDPVVSLWGAPADGGTTLTRLADDDDSGPLSRDALLDTGVLDTAGRYCAAVTTYGDLTWNGTGQGSAGAYQLTISMGNRRPTLTTLNQAMPTPVPPAFLTINETDTVNIDATFADPDNDLLTATWELRDAANQLVSGASFNAATGMGTATWVASQTAARASPYTLTVSVADAEFTVSSPTIITVLSVNVAPTTPVQLTPADDVAINNASPLLVCAESSDVDLDPLQYEFEAYLPAALDAGVPSQTGLVAGQDAGSVEFDGGTYPENTWVSWRVRAFDGNTSSAYSPWTGFWRFFVDVTNDAPPAPVITKPFESEEVLVRRPVISVANPEDPEGDAVTVTFELASNSAFTADLQSSGPVAVNTGGLSTSWAVPADLNWGGNYFARAKALDSRGGDSGYGPTRGFRVKSNIKPDGPTLGSPFGTTCDNLVVTEAPTTFSVGVVVDPEQEPVTVQVRVFAPGADVNSATPLFDETKPQGTTETTFDVSAVAWVEDGQHVVQTRANDGTDTSDWKECRLTLDAQPNGTGGGAGGSGGSGGAGGGDGSTTKPGCGCNAPGGAFGALALVALLWMRRRTRCG